MCSYRTNTFIAWEIAKLRNVVRQVTLNRFESAISASSLINCLLRMTPLRTPQQMRQQIQLGVKAEKTHLARIAEKFANLSGQLVVFRQTFNHAR